MTSKPRVFVTRGIHPEALTQLKAETEVDVWPESFPPPKEILLAKIKNVHALLTMLTDPIDSQVIAAGTDLKVIAQLAVGYDNIDIAAATRRGIPVGHTPGVLTETTADFAWGLMMAAARRIGEAEREVRSGLWQPWGPDVLTGLDIYGKTLGIVGLGRIGNAMARRARGFDMRVLYHSLTRDLEAEDQLSVEYVTLERLLTQSDFISLHLYYSPEAHHLIDRAAFELMKPNAVLVNTARGAIVDPEALTWALQTRRIAAAGIDVFEPEPIPTNHPLNRLQNVVITPHIASAGKETRQKMAGMCVENILAGLNGTPIPWCANPQVYEPRGA
ncbi:MAG TPA: D-glycerate dehydrogenase [Bellilinea sp.]|nr:D-glycerate dehydrogenase [Bellilinea sp.]